MIEYCKLKLYFLINYYSIRRSASFICFGLLRFFIICILIKILLRFRIRKCVLLCNCNIDRRNVWIIGFILTCCLFLFRFSSKLFTLWWRARLIMSAVLPVFIHFILVLLLICHLMQLNNYADTIILDSFYLNISAKSFSIILSFCFK